jgi:hypothetical protein
MANFHRVLRNWRPQYSGWGQQSGQFGGGMGGQQGGMGGQQGNWLQSLSGLLGGLGGEMQSSYHARNQIHQTLQQMAMMSGDPHMVGILAQQLETQPGVPIGVVLACEQIKAAAAAGNPALVQQLVMQATAAASTGQSILGMANQLQNLAPYMDQFHQHYWGGQGGGVGHHHRG